MPKQGGGYFVNVGSAICKKVNLKAGLKVTAAFIIDEEPYQFEMPDVLQAVLDTDDEAFSVFQKLSPGNQRGLMYLVCRVKSPEIRMQRALKIAAQLKIGITSPRAILK